MEKWEIAYDDYMAGMKYKDIAAKYEVTIDVVKGWKKRKWGKPATKKDTKAKPAQKCQTTQKTTQKVPRKLTPAQEANLKKGPARNSFARKHGFYAKWLPSEINEILGEAPTDPLEILWGNIQLQQAKILHSFKIQHVKDKDDYTVRTIASSNAGDTYEYHEAFEKDSAFLQGLSRALATLNTMISSYEKLILEREEAGLTEDIRRAQLERLKTETDRIRSDLEDAEGSAVQVIDDVPDEVPHGSEAD